MVAGLMCGALFSFGCWQDLASGTMGSRGTSRCPPAASPPSQPNSTHSPPNQQCPAHPKLPSSSISAIPAQHYTAHTKLPCPPNPAYQISYCAFHQHCVSSLFVKMNRKLSAAFSGTILVRLDVDLLPDLPLCMYIVLADSVAEAGSRHCHHQP